jgi:5-methylcytosine-specific restriction endonuclease McrA
MFTNNKYTNWYFNIIERAKSRMLLSNIYTEKHHIVPKSLGGSNAKDNIVVLTGREHAICHLLLIRMTEGAAKRSMTFAAWRMMFKSNLTASRHSIGARLYESTRIEMAKAASYRSSQYRHSEESKKKIADSKIGKSREITPEWREKIRQSQIGSKKQSCSSETKQKISEAKTGVSLRPQSTEHRHKVSESKKGKKIHIDPVTGKRYFA